jgi:cytochrome oxidase Cu insertion factor (SCO1/SenC/PrrC family)
LIRRQDLWPLGATGFILAVTASWWALALWSAPGAPEWLERTRSVCFNITESGLPDAKGWLLLLGQPPSMFALLWVGWGQELRASATHLAGSPRGRLLVGTILLLTLGGVSLAGVRVADARVPAVVLPDRVASIERARLDRPWPVADGLVDQRGRPFTRYSDGTGVVLVTFAFGHCETVCPAVVHEARAAREELRPDVAIVVLTLDPWRDTPSRLDGMLTQFRLDPARDLVVGGSVAAVEGALDAWGIARQRDERSGDIVHPTVVYLVETDGTVAFASTGARADIVELAERLGWRMESP